MSRITCACSDTLLRTHVHVCVYVRLCNVHVCASMRVHVCVHLCNHFDTRACMCVQYVHLCNHFDT